MFINIFLRQPIILDFGDLSITDYQLNSLLFFYKLIIISIFPTFEMIFADDKKNMRREAIFTKA